MTFKKYLNETATAYNRMRLPVKGRGGGRHNRDLINYDSDVRRYLANLSAIHQGKKSGTDECGLQVFRYSTKSSDIVGQSQVKRCLYANETLKSGPIIYSRPVVVPWQIQSCKCIYSATTTRVKFGKCLSEPVQMPFLASNDPYCNNHTGKTWAPETLVISDQINDIR